VRVITKELRSPRSREIMQEYTCETLRVIYHESTPDYSGMTPGESAYIELFLDGKRLNFGWGEEFEFEVKP